MVLWIAFWTALLACSLVVALSTTSLTDVRIATAVMLASIVMIIVTAVTQGGRRW